MSDLTYIGGKIHGQVLPASESNTWSLVSTKGEGAVPMDPLRRNHYVRMALTFVLEHGSVVTRDFMVDSTLNQTEATAYARPLMLAEIAAKQSK